MYTLEDVHREEEDRAEIDDEYERGEVPLTMTVELPVAEVPADGPTEVAAGCRAVEVLLDPAKRFLYGPFCPGFPWDSVLRREF